VGTTGSEKLAWIPYPRDKHSSLFISLTKVLEAGTNTLNTATGDISRNRQLDTNEAEEHHEKASWK
jgi:hypothetical protein